MSCDLNSKQKVCWNIDYDILGKKNTYIIIIGIILFLIHIVYSFFICKKFNFNSFLILIIFAAISCIFMIINFLNTKVTSTEEIDNKDFNFSDDINYKVGDYWISDIDTKIDMYIIMIGNIIFLLAFIYYCAINKTSYLNCNDNSFSWKLPVIIVVSWIILFLKGLINLVRKL